MDRRQFLTAAVAGGAAASLISGDVAAEVAAQANPIQTSVRIIIIGAGAAGIALANRLVRRLDGAQITLIDPRRDHHYQPGLTLVAAGLKRAGYVVSHTAQWLPDGVTWLTERVAAVDAEARTVSTQSGETLGYDWLVVAPGLVLDHDAIEGFGLDMVGENGIGALYAGPEYAARTWAAASRFAEEGGTGIFTRPATEMKCAGAPLKHTFLIDDIARRAGNAGKMNMVYAAPQSSLFGVPIVAEKVRMLFENRGVDTMMNRTLTAIDASAKRATFATDGGAEEVDYDYIHIIPPQRAPDFVIQSGLSWADQWIDQGWVECDMQTLRHLRYPEIFCRRRRRRRTEGQDRSQHQAAGAGGRGSHRRRDRRARRHPDLQRLHVLPDDHPDRPRHAGGIRQQRQPCPILSGPDRPARRVVDQLADEGGGAQGHVQRHAARQGIGDAS